MTAVLNPLRLPLLTDLLREQTDLTAVERFSQRHDDSARPLLEPVYRELMPTRSPAKGEQFAFEVNMDACTGCKACVVGCHSLNGLDEAETWRSVGTLRGVQDAQLRTVTTACHHCVDPACMKGCPVNAYEKDPETGVVRHLDDQCIGCQYCTLTCPYDVPQYNERLGIVRKCDMCHDRLKAGEAPACVQSCPNGAISIAIVKTADAQSAARQGEFLETTPDPNLTKPTTIYRSKDKIHALLPADDYAIHPAHNHQPLVIMLVLIQCAVGMFVTQSLLSGVLSSGVQAALSVVALLLTLAALGASTAHLGRPLYAFRAVLGLRTSWMSREIVVFGGFVTCAALDAGLSTLATGALSVPLISAELATTLRPYAAMATAGMGLLGVFTSVMLYHVTGRAYWHIRLTGARFTLTTLALGAAGSLTVGLLASVVELLPAELATTLIVPFGLAWVAFTAVKLLWETRVSHRGQGALARSAALIAGPLRSVQRWRLRLGLLGGVALPLGVLFLTTRWPVWSAATALLALALCITGELLERRLFFTAMASPQMPGDTP